MSDPLGLISGQATGGIRPEFRPAARADSDAPSFKQVLIENLDHVNSLQQDATRAIEDLQSGRRTDLEGVILATQKADNAFRALQAVRNRVMEAYEELKQVRV